MESLESDGITDAGLIPDPFICNNLWDVGGGCRLLHHGHAFIARIMASFTSFMIMLPVKLLLMGTIR